MPGVFGTLEELARLCHARAGSICAFIEDKNSGTILLQQALRRQMPARAIESSQMIASAAESSFAPAAPAWLAGANARAQDFTGLTRLGDGR